MIRYTLIDLCQIRDSEAELVSKAYQLWIEVYEPIFAEANSRISPDYFWRTRLLATLTDDDKLVGFHLYNGFNLLSAQSVSHGYLGQIPLEKINEFKELSFTNIMSCEYLTLHPDYRKNKEFPWAQILIALASEIFKVSNWNLMIGISRTDLKVDQMATNIGASTKGSTNTHNIRCEIMTVSKDKLKPHPNVFVQKQIDWLWQNKSAPLVFNFGNLNNSQEEAS